MDRAFTRSPESAWSNDPGLRAEKIATRLQEELEEGLQELQEGHQAIKAQGEPRVTLLHRCTSRGTSRGRLREMLIVKGHLMGTLKWASRGLHFKGASNLALTIVVVSESQNRI